jgi:tetratricopeptide (TPR) repeat protein
MANGNQEKDGMSLYSLKEALERAQKTEDDQAIITALLDLGFAQIQEREVEEGAAQFDAAFERAGKIPNVELQVRCLGLKSLAYQEIDRFHDAFQTINEVLKIAEQYTDAGIKCDALTSQGQILLDSGEPIVAQEKLNEALSIANDLGDKRRQMNVLGVLGNQSIAVASLAQAEEYFDKAFRLADELGDVQAKFGNLGNKASVLAWQGNNQDAIPGFEKVLDFVHEQGDQSAEIQALRNLVQAHSKLKDNEKALDYALRGVELCKKSNNDTLLFFYETMIVVYYRQGKVQEAQRINQEAVNLARDQNNNSKELEFLLSLGEAQYLSELTAEALLTYQQALEVAKRIDRRTDEAYLTGRIGVALAELGRLDEAIQHHSQAVEFARLWLLPRLEGEQLSMLAMAYYEKGETQKAREYCTAAIQVFTETGLTEEIQKAVQLLKKMDA